MQSDIESLKDRIFSKYQKENWETKTLEEIALEIVSGNEVTKAQLNTGKYPAVKCGDINSSLKQQFDTCISFVDLNIIKKPKYFECGDILMSNMSNKVETLGTAINYLGKNKCLAGDHVVVIKSNQNTKYLTYALSSEYVRDQIKEFTRVGIVCELHKSNLTQIKIPLPTIEIQNEIVEFLDKLMTLKRELEKELSLELENRKKQYEYYKNLMFNRGMEELNWEIKTLEDIAKEIIAGNGVTRAQLKTGNFPAIKCGDINSSLPQQFTECISFVDPDLISNKKYFEKGNVLISKLSNKKETIGTSTIYLSDNKALAGNDVDVIKVREFINPKYLNYSLSSDHARKQIENFAQSGTVFHLYSKNIKQIKIPIPSLEEQEKVVEFLDKLYTITNDINSGIPLLIEKIQKQYNFYKETLIGLK